MAHPNISKAREDRNQAHADVVANLRSLRSEIATALQLAGGRHHIPRQDLDTVERLVDDTKRALTFYANACATVSFMEES